ncbi:MAG TPA: hypothetical protein VN697_11030, partial [Tepidiformaceae bacterium]|nr:hypothetical protein [Tepidiformaceae bacterium]
MTLALHGKSRKRQGGLLLAALLALIAATLGGLALFSSALAGTPNSGNKSNLQSGQALFSNVTVSKASTMSCTAENSATSFGTSMTFTLSATSPANAYFVLYLSANGGSNAAPAGNVSNNEVQVPVGGLAAGTHTVPVTLPVTSAFTETKGGVLIVISDDTSGTLFNAKSNSLNCTEATPNGNIVVKKVGNFSAGLVAGGFSGPVTGPDGFSTTWTADVGGSDSISVVPGTGYGVSEDTT